MNKTKIIVFCAIVLLGLVISLFTLNMCGTPVEVDGENANGKEPTTAAVPDAGVSGDPKESTPKTDPKSIESKKGGKKGEKEAVKAPTESAKPNIFQSPQALLSALSDKVKARDFAAFEEIVGAEAMAEVDRAKVKSLIENDKLVIDGKAPFAELSKSADSVRWAIQLNSADGAGEGEAIYTDIAKKSDKEFDISKVSLPIDVAKLMSAASGEAPADPASPDSPNSPTSPSSDPASTTPDAPKNATSPAKNIDTGGADAVAIAHAFSKAVVGRDFETARALSDPATVTDERVAALLIAMEEGDFELQKDRPLIVTLSREDITWVLTRIEAGGQTSEFAQELGKVGTDWKINGLTFSKVIASLANRAGGGNVAYAPIVEDPTGGDSLVLYFEFDASGVTERTRRQLAIVSDILKKNPTRKLRINGHADAKGSDDYNARLSEKRAGSVRETLISQGVTPTQIITEAFGESRPRTQNFNADGTDNLNGQSANRRAEVYLDF